LGQETMVKIVQTNRRGKKRVAARELTKGDTYGGVLR